MKLDQLEQKYDHIYYFKKPATNPLGLKEPGETLTIENTEITVEDKGTTQKNGVTYGWIAGEPQ